MGNRDSCGKEIFLGTLDCQEAAWDGLVWIMEEKVPPWDMRPAKKNSNEQTSGLCIALYSLWSVCIIM